jgi:hypothetical protein
MRVGITLAALFAATLAAGAAMAADPQKPALPGWYGVFPELRNYNLTYQPPSVDPKAKDVYGQTVKYDWMGGDFRVFRVTLARDPDFKKKYDPDVLKKDPAVTKSTVGKRDAWHWQLSKPGEGGIEKPNSRLVVILGDDRALIVEATGSPTADQFTELSGVDLAKLAAALDNPPRADAKRTLDTFKAIPKGATYRDVVEWAGQPKEDVGSGIHVMVFPLDDGTQVLLGTPDFQKVVYVKHKDKDGKVTDLGK